MKNIISLLLFLFVGASANLPEVPTGCVTIFNTYYKDYLKAANWYDKNHRHVKHAAGSQQFEISKSGNHYRIMQRDLKEYLFTSDWKQLFDNKVFLWIPKTDEASDKWEIKLYDRPNIYVIKNVKHNKCMYTGPHEWIYAGESPTCHNQGMHWKIEKC